MSKAKRRRLNPHIVIWLCLLFTAVWAGLTVMSTADSTGFVPISFTFEKTVTIAAAAAFTGFFGGVAVGVLALLVLWFPSESALLRGMRLAAGICLFRAKNILDSNFDLAMAARQEAMECYRTIEDNAALIESGGATEFNFEKKMITRK